MASAVVICPECRNQEFIVHSSSSMQCSKCGKYYDGDGVARYRFVNEFCYEEQEPILKNKIEQQNAKLIATYFPHNIHCEPFLLASSYPLHTDSGSYRPAPYCWADIYKTASGNVIVAYYLKFMGNGDIFGNRVTTDGTILLISNELPVFDSINGTGNSYLVPVQNPDKLVYTGATVGGISTGGFHTQSGGVHYETLSFNYHQKVHFTAGTFRGSPIIFTAEPGRLDLYEYENLPERLKKKTSKPDSFDIEKRMVRYKHQQMPDLENTLMFAPLVVENDDFKDIIFGATSSDEQLYKKACDLMQKGKKKFLYEAISLFERLGDYKDCRVKKETCKRNLEQAEEDRKTRIKVIIWGCAALIAICMLIMYASS